MSKFLNYQLDKEIEQIKNEENELVFPSFSRETAWTLGNALLHEARQKNISLTLDIRLRDQILFHFSMEGTNANNERWVEMKSNCAMLMNSSSYRCGLENKRDNTTLESRHFLPPGKYADHGGSFPLRVQGNGLLGAITVSGLPQKEDHLFVTSVIRQFIQDYFQ